MTNVMLQSVFRSLFNSLVLHCSSIWFYDSAWLECRDLWWTNLIPKFTKCFRPVWLSKKTGVGTRLLAAYALLFSFLCCSNRFPQFYGLFLQHLATIFGAGKFQERKHNHLTQILESTTEILMWTYIFLKKYDDHAKCVLSTWYYVENTYRKTQPVQRACFTRKRACFSVQNYVLFP